MKTTLQIIAVSLMVLFLSQCAPTRFVKTLNKKEKAASFSFGGPIIQYSGAAIPIPFTTLAFGYGLTNKNTLFASLHPTSLLFGNLQTDIGSTFLLFEKKEIFGISATPALQLAYSIGNAGTFKIWPSADVNYYYHIKKRASYLYAGVNTWIELSGTKAHGEKVNRHLIPNMQIGYNVVGTKWQHQFELKYLGIGIPNLPNVTGYIGVGGKGSFGIYYSLIKNF